MENLITDYNINTFIFGFLGSLALLLLTVLFNTIVKKFPSFFKSLYVKSYISVIQGHYEQDLLKSNHYLPYMYIAISFSILLTFINIMEVKGVKSQNNYYEFMHMKLKYKLPMLEDNTTNENNITSKEVLKDIQNLETLISNQDDKVRNVLEIASYISYFLIFMFVLIHIRFAYNRIRSNIFHEYITAKNKLLNVLPKKDVIKMYQKEKEVLDEKTLIIYFKQLKTYSEQINLNIDEVTDLIKEEQN